VSVGVEVGITGVLVGVLVGVAVGITGVLVGVLVGVAVGVGVQTRGLFWTDRPPPEDVLVGGR
jgi:hypothetical protein